MTGRRVILPIRMNAYFRRATVGRGATILTVDQPVVVRSVVAEDTTFLQRMLYEAVNTRPGKTWPDFEVSMGEPRNRRFWFAWGAPVISA